MPFDYDDLCMANKERNIKLLQDLGGSIDLEIPKVVKQPKQHRAAKKRKVTPPSSDTESEGGAKVSKRQKGVQLPPKHADDQKEPSPETNGLRRSGRSRKKVDYSADNFEKAKPQLASSEARLRDRSSEPKLASKRMHNPSVLLPLLGDA